MLLPIIVNCNFSRISITVFEIFTVKDRKLLILPIPPFFDGWRTRLGGTP